MNAGIVEVIASMDYHASTQSKRIFKEGGIRFRTVSGEVQKYKNM